MDNEVEVKLKPGAPCEDCDEVARAFVRWCMLSREAAMSQRLRLIIRGGLYLTPEDMAAFWRAEVSPDAVDDLLINGTSLMNIDTNINPECGDKGDTPAAATA